MDTKVDDKKKIEEIIKQIKCSKNFQCYTSGFENLAKVRKIGTYDLLECLSKKAGNCEFSFPFGSGYFCKCPVRAYIAEKLGK